MLNNRHIKSSIAIFLLAIYCFAIGIVYHSVGFTPVQASPTASQENFILHFSAKLSCATTYYTENAENNFQNTPVFNAKKSVTGFWAQIVATGQLVHTAFTQYIGFLKVIPVKQRKANLIFPFHYFW